MPAAKSLSPDDGEEKSLSNTTRKAANQPVENFKLHNFPDIPVEEPSSDTGCSATENNFKRIHFEPAGSSCSHARKIMVEHEAASGPATAAETEDRAYQKGFQQGHKAGIDSQRAKVESAVRGLEQAIIHIQNLRAELYSTIEREVVELALGIARKVVCREIKTNKDIVVCVAKEALSRVEVPGEIKIRLNPADLQFIKETKGPISSLLEHVDNVTFEAEELISSGGCVIETNLGELDARIENQLQVVAEMFQTEMAKSEPEENSDQPS